LKNAGIASVFEGHKLQFLKGTGFSPYINQPESPRALLAAEKSIVLKGHGFSRATNSAESAGL
jgi:hypothetical protein